MQTITTYKWEDEVWGAASAPGTNDRDTISWNNFSYWGQDVWETRQYTANILLTFVLGRMGCQRYSGPYDTGPLQYELCDIFRQQPRYETENGS